MADTNPRKAIDLETQADLVCDAVCDAIMAAGGPMPEYEEPGPCVYAYADHAIVCTDEGDWSVPYTIDGAAVTVAPVDQWVEVLQSWQPVPNPRPFPTGDPDAMMKASRRHSANDQQHLDQAAYHLHQAGANPPRGMTAAPDTRPIGAKAGLEIADQAHDMSAYASIKALADRHLEVKVAFYGHKNGKDSHGEYFSPNTDFAVEDWPTPPLLYYHGYDERGKKMSKPVTTGKFVSRRSGPDGHYLTYKLRNNRYADLQWDAALKGTCVVSPGTVGHLIRPGTGGELLYWPLAEVSAWDYADNRKPANLHSIAAPVLKALYIEEGLTPPHALDTASDTPSETAGDAVSTGDLSAGPSISSQELTKALATALAEVMLSIELKGTH